MIIEQPKGRNEMTKKELEVLRCLCEGLSTKQIQARLNVAEGTIKVHLHSMFKKFNVNSRHQLVALVLNGKLSLGE
jgi:two-component system nitrate/nitrite response regulator NarL